MGNTRTSYHSILGTSIISHKYRSGKIYTGQLLQMNNIDKTQARYIVHYVLYTGILYTGYHINSYTFRSFILIHNQQITPVIDIQPTSRVRVSIKTKYSIHIQALLSTQAIFGVPQVCCRQTNLKDVSPYTASASSVQFTALG